MPDDPAKKRKGCLIVAVVLLLLLLIPVTLFWLMVRSFEQQETHVDGGSVLEINLSQLSGEGPAEIDFGPLFSVPLFSLWELGRVIDHAATDDDIVAVRLLPSGASVGWAAAEEILSHLDSFRDSDKPVHALLESDIVVDLEYFLATGADRIRVPAESAAAINGLAAEAHFYRGTLDKLHIEPQVFMYKEYKSAGEAYANYEMSPYMRESLEVLLEATHDLFVKRVSERRGLPIDSIHAFLERGLAPARALVEAGLVDNLGFREDLEEELGGIDGSDGYRGISVGDYLASLPDTTRRGEKIALVFGEGPVVTRASSSLFPLLSTRILAGNRVAADIREATADDQVRAIVFRVNSPGGSVLGSDLVRRAVVSAQAAGKPVVVSMSDMAASGGYWVSMEADAIVAQATTITGSIGVLFTKLNLDGFFAWLGTHVERVATSPAAHVLSTGPLDESEEAGIRAWMDEVYASFTGHIATARGLDPEKVQEIARGRVWSGQDALELGLVDRLGGLREAFEIAKEKAGLDPLVEYGVTVFPRPKSLFTRLFEGDLEAPSMPILERSALIEWARGLAAPQVQARAPHIRIH